MYHIRWAGSRLRKCSCDLPAYCKYQYGRGWILCRRLEWERGTVSSRVALLLRSAEVKPLFYRFVQLRWTLLSLSFFITYHAFTSGQVHLDLATGRCLGLVLRKQGFDLSTTAGLWDVCSLCYGSYKVSHEIVWLRELPGIQFGVWVADKTVTSVAGLYTSTIGRLKFRAGIHWLERAQERGYEHSQHGRQAKERAKEWKRSVSTEAGVRNI